jgi:hypothetical protein
VGAAGLEFAGFSNPEVWDPARLLQGELLERARALPQRDQWALVEELDPDISHFEFFLAKPPLARHRWQGDAELLAARGRINRCLWGWPSTDLLGPDLQPLTIEPADLELLQAMQAAPETTLGALPLAAPSGERLARARRLLEQALWLPVL